MTFKSCLSLPFFFYFFVIWVAVGFAGFLPSSLLVSLCWFRRKKRERKRETKERKLRNRRRRNGTQGFTSNCRIADVIDCVVYSMKPNVTKGIVFIIILIFFLCSLSSGPALETSKLSSSFTNNGGDAWFPCNRKTFLTNNLELFFFFLVAPT